MSLIKFGLLERMKQIMYNLKSSDIYSGKYFVKSLDLIIKILSLNTEKIRSIISESNIIKIILTFLNTPQKFEIQHLEKLMKIVIGTTTNQTVNKLDSLGILKVLVKLHDFFLLNIEEMQTKEQIEPQSNEENQK
mmetsp:Transcript_20989/g.24209  ORF Transcript_20989/g.24209 Transcript_20989/m.24209 type:complete len:135 (-) Transcript_20989:761-1165(-)